CARPGALCSDRGAPGSGAAARFCRRGMGAGGGGAMRLLRLSLSLALWLGAPIAAVAHVTATGLAIVSADAATVTYRLNLVPAELADSAAALLTRAASGDRDAAERLAAAMREAVSISADGQPCRPGRVLVQAGSGGSIILGYT